MKKATIERRDGFLVLCVDGVQVDNQAQIVIRQLPEQESFVDVRFWVGEHAVRLIDSDDD